jgi:hypothetical protein
MKLRAEYFIPMLRSADNCIVFRIQNMALRLSEAYSKA